MTANIDPVQRAKLAADASPKALPAVKDPAVGEHLAKAQEAPGLSSTELPPTPPPELALQIAAAAHAWDALAQIGQNVAFEEGPDGRLQIRLEDQDGNDLGTLSGSGLFDLIEEKGGA